MSTSCVNRTHNNTIYFVFFALTGVEPLFVDLDLTVVRADRAISSKLPTDMATPIRPISNAMSITLVKLLLSISISPERVRVVHVQKQTRECGNRQSEARFRSIGGDGIATSFGEREMVIYSSEPHCDRRRVRGTAKSSPGQ